MCGRFSLRVAPTWAEYHKALSIIEPTGPHRPFFNIAPGTTKPLVVIERGGEYIAQSMKFGFSPHWSASKLFINARDDALFVSRSSGKRAMWAGPITTSRCLIFADGIYEPEGAKDGSKRPWWFFEKPGSEVFAMGGLWTQRTDKETGEVIESFAIITTEPPEWQTIHHRWPFMPGEEEWASWLDPEPKSREEIEGMIHAYDGTAFDSWRVSDRAKSPQYDDAACIERIEATRLI